MLRLHSSCEVLTVTTLRVFLRHYPDFPRHQISRSVSTPIGIKSTRPSWGKYESSSILPNKHIVRIQPLGVHTRALLFCCQAGLSSAGPPPSTSNPSSGLHMCGAVAAPHVLDMILARHRSTSSSSRCKRNVFCAVLIFFSYTLHVILPSRQVKDGPDG